MYEYNWKLLLNSEKLGRLSHAYILSGNDEESKTKLVNDFTQFLVCEDKDRPCKKCRYCKEVAEKRHPDVFIVKPEDKDIKISQVRNLISSLSKGAWQSAWKVAIIENADSMTSEAQSALLKLLEEPKGDVVIFLVPRHAYILLDTIRSRAQELRFNSFALKESAESAKTFEKLATSSIYERFEYAKSMSENPENILSTLYEWLVVSRRKLLLALKEHTEDITYRKRIVKNIQEIITLLRTTNVNSRLAIEQILLSL